MRYATIAIGLATLSSGVWLTSGLISGGSQAPRSLTAADYSDIQQLYAQYSHGIDSGADNGQLFADAFTPDGTLVTPNLTIKGTGELMALATRGANKGPTNVLHFPTNIMIQPSPEGARGFAYVALINVGADGAPSRVSGGGVYHDIFVKYSGRWRILKRTYFRAHSNLALVQ